MSAQTKPVQLSKINISGGTQPRASLDLDAVDDYCTAILAEIELPPAVTYFDGSEHWLADGFHRYHANAKAERTKMLCEVRKGTLRDAILYAVSANGNHGLRRTNADKRHAVGILLADKEWSARSDRWIADTCAVHHDLVAKLRSKPNGQVAENATSTKPSRKGQDGKEYPAKQSRKVTTPKPEAAPEPDPAPAPKPAPKPPEPNVIGEFEEAFASFLEQHLAGQKPFMREAMLDKAEIIVREARIVLGAVA